MILQCRSLLTASLISALAVASAEAQQQPTRPAVTTTAAPKPAAPASAAPRSTAPAAAPKPATAAAGQTPAAKPAAAPATQARTAAAPAGQARPAAASSAPTAGADLVATVGDWAVYTAQTGRSKICYASAQPQQRLPAGLNRDPAYLFVTVRPSENIRNEVALVVGFTTKDTVPAEAVIGNSSFTLLTKAGSAWLKNPAEEAQAIASMARGQSLTVKLHSARGNALTDRYSLIGFAQAVERARKECS